MRVGLTFLAPSEVEAALLLAKGQSVGVFAPLTEVPALRAQGFSEAPASLECFVRAPVPTERRTHRHRNTARSLREWRERQLVLEITSLGKYGFDRFLESVYFPIFARAMFLRAITPHGAHDVAGMRALVNDESDLALVRCGGTIVGAAVLRPGRALTSHDRAYGGTPHGGWYEGLIYVLHESLRSCQRALLVHLADAYGARGHTWLSLGQEAVWCEKGYDTVLREKLRVADALVCRFDNLTRMFNWRSREGEQFAFFEWGSGDQVKIQNHGYDEASYADLVSAFEVHACLPQRPIP